MRGQRSYPLLQAARYPLVLYGVLCKTNDNQKSSCISRYYMVNHGLQVRNQLLPKAKLPGSNVRVSHA